MPTASFPIISSFINLGQGSSIGIDVINLRESRYIYFSDLTSRHFSQLQFQLPNLSNDFSNSPIANAASAMSTISSNVLVLNAVKFYHLMTINGFNSQYNLDQKKTLCNEMVFSTRSESIFHGLSKFYA
ncbi:hypothetical protein BpHYR1_023000 [Brachionus plicatilis]|uniref:Uncharacterized protein n=1 Tax=Brachionus plicatilis TaxID=10195 RepID=A0A3M7QWL5_BRAPC|nr:hypothetical protein BpHYR1_023000 [Brachionus plicatilis]